MTVTLVDPLGPDSLVWASLGDAILSIRVGADEEFVIGENLEASFQARDVSVFDGNDGRRI